MGYLVSTLDIKNFDILLGPREYPKHKKIRKNFLGRVETLTETIEFFIVINQL